MEKTIKTIDFQILFLTKHVKYFDHIYTTKDYQNQMESIVKIN